MKTEQQLGVRGKTTTDRKRRYRYDTPVKIA